MAKQKYFVEVGQKFGHFTVIEDSKSGHVLCRCDCPKQSERMVVVGTLVAGKHNSCGCSRAGKINVTHGETHTRLWKIWVSMLSRCGRVTSGSYKHYGGRGITVCPNGNHRMRFFETGHWRTDTLKPSNATEKTTTEITLLKIVAGSTTKQTRAIHGSAALCKPSESLK